MFSNFGWVYLSLAISSKSRFSLKRLLIRRIADIVLFYRLSAYSVDSDSPLFVLFSDEEIFYADIFHFLRNMSMFTAFVVNIVGEYKSIKSKNNILMS